MSRNILRIVVLVTGLFIAFGCQESKNQPVVDTFTVKSSQLINQILLDKEFFDCSCFLGFPEQTLLELAELTYPESKIRTRSLDALEINDLNTLDSLDRLSRNLNVADLQLSFDIDLLPRAMFDSILRKHGSVRGKEILWEKCPEGWLYMSRPVFNKDYTTAIIEVSVCSPGGSVKVYDLIDGNWVLRERLISWIS